MSDLSIPAAGVIPSSAAVIRTGTAGATLVAGNVVYSDAAASGVMKAATCLSATGRVAAGFALNGASAGQPINYVERDPDLTIGTGLLTVGKVYVLSEAGAICPIDDLAAGDYPVVCGIATTTAKMSCYFCPENRGSAVVPT